jgi:hypothetical protein
MLLRDKGCRCGMRKKDNGRLRTLEESEKKRIEEHT